MQPQEIFDTVVNHLFTQKTPAMEGSSCRYRSGDGLKCAVGCLIPDEMYHRSMENKSVGCLLDHQAELDYALPQYFRRNIDLLSALQAVHDTFGSSLDRTGHYTTEYLNEGFTNVAQYYGLNYDLR